MTLFRLFCSEVMAFHQGGQHQSGLIISVLSH